MPTRVTANADASNISSNIKVSDFLNEVKEYYGDSLSEDVNNHLGRLREKSDIEGLLYQDRTISPGTYSLKLKNNANFKEGRKNADEMYRKTKGVELSDRAIDMLVKKLEKDSGTNVSSDVLYKKLKKAFENARTRFMMMECQWREVETN